MPRGVSANKPVACVRCRRQKLKCDKAKPCLLCARAGIECQSRDSSFSPYTTQRQKHEGNASTSSPTASVGSSEASYFPQAVPTCLAPISTPTGTATRLASTSSAMRFAQRLLGHTWEAGATVSPIRTENELLHILIGDPQLVEAASWQFVKLQRPPFAIIKVLMDVYFRRAHWFMLLLHAPSANLHAEELWQKPLWRRTEAGDVLVFLAVAAMGAQCIKNDPTSRAHQCLREHGIEPAVFSQEAVAEITLHLLDIVADCSLASVQLCLLLGRFHAYAGNPGVSWSLVGMAARNAYAAGLHIPSVDVDDIHNEVKRRVWLTSKATDNFSAFFHGRPPSLSCDFLYASETDCMDDMILAPQLAQHPALNRSATRINLFTFHRLKYELYEIMGRAAFVFRQIRNGATWMDNGRLRATILSTEAALMEWKSRLPTFFDCCSWEGDDPLHVADWSSEAASHEARILTLQGMTLQVVLDSNIIMLHRPVIELGLSDCSRVLANLDQEDVAHSMEAAVAAGLRISTVSIQAYEKESALAYVLMACLSASVVLCLPPVHEPMSALAHQCKEGLLRIIHACKKLSSQAPLAEHVAGLLSSLMTSVIQQETALALANDAGVQW